VRSCSGRCASPARSTYALGWGLARSDALLARFLRLCGVPEEDAGAAEIDLQRHGADSAQPGITDIEIDTPRTRVIVEAKRGWNLPDLARLERYTPRFADARDKTTRIVVLTQWGEEQYARSALGTEVDGYRIATVGLGQVARAAEAVARDERRPATRQLVGGLARYLLSVADLRNPNDNRVWTCICAENMAAWLQEPVCCHAWEYQRAGRGRRRASSARLSIEPWSRGVPGRGRAAKEGGGKKGRGCSACSPSLPVQVRGGGGDGDDAEIAPTVDIVVVLLDGDRRA